jgi:hypothetical protein
MSNWDRPSDYASSAAFDANRYATLSYVTFEAQPSSVNAASASASSAAGFRAPVFEPPPSFGVDSSNTAVSAVHLPAVIGAAAADPSAYRAVQFHYPGPAPLPEPAPVPEPALAPTTAPSLAGLAPAEVQLVPLGRRSASGDVRAIVAFARSSAPRRIVCFEFQFHSGNSLFAPQHFESGDGLSQVARWELLDGESLACAHVLSNQRGLSPTAWMFETSARRMSIVFGSASGNPSMRAFAMAGVDALHLNGSGDSSGALPPVYRVSARGGEKMGAPSSLLSVGIETNSSGVNMIAFLHQSDHASQNESYGFHANASSAQTIHLQDAGTANAETVAEVV